MFSQHDPNQPLALREKFLERLSTKLKEGLSPIELYETIKEIRAHLSASAAAYEELGLGPIEAMSSAIAIFGDPKLVARQILEEIRQPTPKTLPLALFISIGAVISAPLMLAADYLMVVTGTVASQSPETGIVGLITGAILGARLHVRPRKPFTAALRAGLLIPVCLLAFILLLNRTWPGVVFLGMTLICFGTANAIAAAITSFLFERAPSSRFRTAGKHAEVD